MAYSKYRKNGELKKKPGRKPDPNKPPKRPAKYVKGVERPFMWKYPDPILHEMHMPFLKAKAQANFRGEGWNMELEEFYELWKDHWHKRGRKIDDMCMSRKDTSTPWTFANTQIITRHEHLIEQGHARRAQGMRYYKKGRPGPKGPRNPQEIPYAKMKVQK